jgi:hypothetical protein
MAVFSGDSPLKLFQAAAESEFESSSAKFARKGEIVCLMKTSGGFINHKYLCNELDIDPMTATDLGEIGITYNKFCEPPMLTVDIIGRSMNYPIHASDEARLETGTMMEPYFRKYLPKFIKYVGLEIVDFNFACKPFGPKS